MEGQEEEEEEEEEEDDKEDDEEDEEDDEEDLDDDELDDVPDVVVEADAAPAKRDRDDRGRASAGGGDPARTAAHQPHFPREDPRPKLMNAYRVPSKYLYPKFHPSD